VVDSLLRPATVIGGAAKALEIAGRGGVAGCSWRKPARNGSVSLDPLLGFDQVPVANTRGASQVEIAVALILRWYAAGAK